VIDWRTIKIGDTDSVVNFFGLFLFSSCLNFLPWVVNFSIVIVMNTILVLLASRRTLSYPSVRFFYCVNVIFYYFVFSLYKLIYRMSYTNIIYLKLYIKE